MITIRSTGDVPLEGLEKLIAGGPFGEFASVDSRQYFFKSVEPPSWVQFILSLQGWQALLGAGLSIFTTGIISAAGKETWEKRAKIPQAFKAGSLMLLELAKSIVTLQDLVGPATRIEVGVPLDDDAYSALLTITATTPETVEAQLAQLSVHADSLGQLLARSDTSPVGWIILELTADGGLAVRWMDKESLDQHEVLLALETP